jgi:hypothetical protein
MKRVLLAATALAALPGLAQAQAVTIGGEGRMGIIYESVSLLGTSFSDWAQENRLVLNFDVAVAADHGLSFGAHSRVQIDNGSTGVFSGSHVYVEASGLRLSFGNLDGAIITAGVAGGYPGCGVGYVGGHYCGDSAGLVGLFYLGLNNPPGFPPNAVIQAAQAQEFDYTGGGSPALMRLDYSFGNTQVALSHERGGATELGVSTSFDAITVALGYSNRAAASIATPDGIGGLLVSGNVVTISGQYDGGTWGAGVLLARVSYSGALSPLSHTNWSLSGNVELAGGNLYGYVGRVHHAGIFGVQPMRTVGMSYGYGLGGGATLTAGIEQVRYSGPLLPGGVRFTSASVGVAFSF